MRNEMQPRTPFADLKIFQVSFLAKQIKSRSFIYRLGSFAVEMKFTLELVAFTPACTAELRIPNRLRGIDARNFVLFALNMMQFTLSTVLYLSINLFEESLFLALRIANSRTLCLILFDLRTRAERSARQNKEKPRRMRKQIFIT